MVEPKDEIIEIAELDFEQDEPLDDSWMYTDRDCPHFDMGTVYDGPRD